MKKSNYLFIIAVFAFLITNIYGQKPAIVLTFIGQYEGEYVQLESVYIENLSKGGDTTIYSSNLVLNYIIGIEETGGVLENALTISQNRPNPFTEQTSISIFLPQSDYLQVSVTNLLGQRIASYENTLAAGNHSFVFEPGTDKYYILSATANGMAKAIKMVCMNNYSGKTSSLVYQGFEELQEDHKSSEDINGFSYSLGDQLRFTGIAQSPANVTGGDVIMDAPEDDETYLFQITNGIPCHVEPYVWIGLKYKTVLIGNQCWFKENLNVGSMITGSLDQSDNGVLERYCYGNESGNCWDYGGLYQWDEAMRYSTEEGAQGICPDGWHIPSDKDFCLMTKYLDISVDCSDHGWNGTDIGTKMKSTSDWGSGNGTDPFGFKALPGGVRELNGSFGGTGDGKFWTSTSGSGGNVWHRDLADNKASIDRDVDSRDYGLSVRCMRDVGIPCGGVSTVTDADGNVYNTVAIGNQCWMKENLKVGIQIMSQNYPGEEWIEKYCYLDIPFNCELFGGLYTWSEMMGDYKSTTEKAQGICPDGWHIPSIDEWKLLYGTVDSQYPVDDSEWDSSGESIGYDAGLKLKSSEGWISGNGTDEFGFTGLPTSYRNNEGDFGSLGYPLDGYYWTSTADFGWKFTKLMNDSDEIDFSGFFPMWGLAVRCLKD